MTVEERKQQLFKYMGKSPCPPDIDKFWNESLSEMEKLGTAAELVPAEYSYKNAEAFHLYFGGVDGSKIHAKYIRPKNAENVPVIFLFHGYGGDSPGWVSLLPYVCEGFAVAALDCRGQAGLSQDFCAYGGNTLHGHLIRGLETKNPKELLFGKIFLDTAQLVRIVEKMKEIDKTKMYTKGVSQGGALALACAALSPEISKCAVCFPFLSDYRFIWESGAVNQAAYSEIKEFFYNFDPRHEQEEAIFNCLSYIDIQNLAGRIKAEVMMFTGLADVICPPETQMAVYNKIKSCKQILFYPDYGHEYLRDSEEIMLEWLTGNTLL